VIVDYRDFRSELPAYLYYSGLHVVPMMLKTGDYVLSNQVVIERKAVDTGDL
jgi:ERCC4-type nuclease